jgi:citronellol/citronellal dehydrogenase
MERISNIKSSLTASACPKLVPFLNLKNMTIVISGGSRGIGLAIAKRAAADGAKIAILAKTTEVQKDLPGTIYSAAKEIEALGGKALAIKCDIRNEEDIKKAIAEVVAKFGGIDVLVNNASAIFISGTEDTPSKKYD